MPRICKWCGEQLTQLDITQRDAEGGYWHCVCADIALVEIASLRTKEATDEKA